MKRLLIPMMLSALGSAAVYAQPATQNSVTVHPRQDTKQLVIQVFDAQSTMPSQTLRIPMSVVAIAADMLPPEMAESLKKEGIQLKQIADMATEKNITGTIATIENHKDNMRLVVAIETITPQPQ